MKETSQKLFKGLFAALAIAVAFILLFEVGDWLFGSLISDSSSMLGDLFAEFRASVLAVILVFVTRKTFLFKPNGGYWKGLLAGGYLLILTIFAVLLFLSQISGRTFKSAHEIVYFFLTMIFVGFCEELIFRGVVLDYIHSVFGSSTRKGAILTALVSGAIFGVVHLINLTFVDDPMAAVYQAVTNIGAGFCYGAVFLRCRNIWSLMTLHAISDMAAMLDAGLLAGGTTDQAISSLNPTVMIGALVYIGIGLFLLRKDKMHYEESDPQPAE